MSRYIDADKLIDDICLAEKIVFGILESKLVKDIIEQQPTADVVEVVRCKDCVHCADDWNGNQPMFTCDIAMCHESVEPSGYCFCGERREDAT